MFLNIVDEWWGCLFVECIIIFEIVFLFFMWKYLEILEVLRLERKFGLVVFGFNLVFMLLFFLLFFWWFILFFLWFFFKFERMIFFLLSKFRVGYLVSDVWECEFMVVGECIWNWELGIVGLFFFRGLWIGLGFVGG